MTEITAEGPVSTTTVIDNKNGTVPRPHVKMSKKSVSEDFATTFSSPAAWLLVVALIITWSAVAIVMFDLVDYKTLAGQSVHKLTTDPLRIIHGAVEETTDRIYGFLSLLTDLIFEDEDESEKGEVEPSLKIKEGIQPPVKRKEIQIEKPEKQEKIGKPPPKEIQIDKSEKHEKIEKKPPLKAIPKEKPEKPEKHEKPEKAKKPGKPEKVEKPGKKELSKVIHKGKPERHEKPEKKEKLEKRGKLERPEKVGKAKEPPKEKPAKQEKPKKKAPPFPKVTEKVKPEWQEKTGGKVAPKDKKTTGVEDEAKKDVKERKQESKAPERAKHKETKAEEVAPAKAKVKAKEETALVVTDKSDEKDQYAFCRYMIDMFAHGDLYTGPPPSYLFLPQTPAMTPAIPAAEVGKPNVTATKLIKDEKRKKVVQEKKAIPEIKMKEVEEGKKITHEKKVVHEVKKKDVVEEKKVTHAKKAVSEIKAQGKKEERTKVPEKTAVPEVKKADKKAVLTKDLKKPAKAPAAQPASVKEVAPVSRISVADKHAAEPHKKEKPVETAKLPKKDVPVKVPGLLEKKEDKPLKVVEQDKPKPKESKHFKDKETKHHAAMKDKDAAKEKVKPPVAAKEKEAVKTKEVKTPVVQKQKEPDIKKEGSPAKTGKKVEHKPPKQEALRHEKEVPQEKTAKSKETTTEITVADKKKTEKPLNEKEGKTIKKTHFKEEKTKAPTVKETHHHHNMTTEKISKAARTKGYTEINATRKEKSAVRYYQCVFVNGYNGYTSQHPVTPIQDYKGKAGQPKASGQKTKTLKQ
ncbi:triadin isoform X3 [Rhineura floridana]|uniref:triadin isoform X3 n=1 Tax=Rhineura floridana TaxID=261503 RepID=UPI002AC7EA23|nr:triadin isoform X3 [Rhineura floridana]